MEIAIIIIAKIREIITYKKKYGDETEEWEQLIKEIEEIMYNN